MVWSGLGCVESCKLEDTGHGYIWLFLCMCWIQNAITCRAKHLIFGRKWSPCFEFWSFNRCVFVFVPCHCAPKKHNNTSTGLLSLPSTIRYALAQTGGGPPRVRLKLSSNLHYHYLRYKSRNLSVKKKHKKIITGFDRWWTSQGEVEVEF